MTRSSKPRSLRKSSTGRGDDDPLESRRIETASRLADLRSELSDAEEIAAGKACIYAIGSFGRCEASKHSDLDLFILGKTKQNKTGTEHRLLNRLDEIRIKADLIETTRAFNIPEFSGDGKYLLFYTVHDLLDTLGKPEDDVTNTFTARLLLLLESCPLAGEDIYNTAIGQVIKSYWRDFDRHKDDFMPAFLANDILRLWRTFCVNYEANTESESQEQRAKRRLKNYKLKHNRLLTCYSALLYLLAIYERKGTVTPRAARKMIGLTPTQRLEWMLEQPWQRNSHNSIEQLLRQYRRFLTATNRPEKTLLNRFLNDKNYEKYTESASKFGDSMFAALSSIGNGGPFHRILMV